ncbi:MAG: hypothetical protein V2I39_12675 [Erythrobacter sp.]|nr:hypothetical protein [Erythrobacter sp.]
MRPERLLFASHSLALGFAFAVALFCPRPGEPALLVPLGSGGLGAVTDWAEREDARFLLLDTGSEGARSRAVAPLPSHGSLLRALAAGILPIAAGKGGCAQSMDGERQWKS